MKNTRAVLVLVLAVIAGLGAMVLAARWITGQVSYEGPKLAVAARDINLGTPVDASMIQMVDWPQGARPDGAFDDPKKLDGRVLKTSVLRGEPLLENKLAPVGTKGGLSAVISVNHGTPSPGPGASLEAPSRARAQPAAASPTAARAAAMPILPHTSRLYEPRSAQRRRIESAAACQSECRPPARRALTRAARTPRGPYGARKQAIHWGHGRLHPYLPGAEGDAGLLPA